MIVKLALENGTVFTGENFGAEGEITGEVVFDRSITGYQETHRPHVRRTDRYNDISAYRKLRRQS